MMRIAKALGRNALIAVACSLMALVLVQPGRWVAERAGWPIAMVGTLMLLALGATALDWWRERNQPDSEEPDSEEPGPKMPHGTTILVIHQRPWWPVVVMAFIGAISFGFALGSKSAPTIINYVPGASESADGGAGGERGQ